MKKMTHEDVKTIRHCANEIQRLNELHYGGKPGALSLRELSERTNNTADKLEKRLRA